MLNDKKSLFVLESLNRDQRGENQIKAIIFWLLILLGGYGDNFPLNFLFLEKE